MIRKSYLTSNEVAALLRVTPVTVRQWCQKGMLDAEYTPGGHRRFLIHEIERFAATHGISLQGSPAHKLDVLVVDRDEQACAAIVEQLGMVAHKVGQNIRVETATNCYVAVAKAVYFRPQYVLIDEAMIEHDMSSICDVMREYCGRGDLQVLVISSDEPNDGYDQEVYYAKDVDSLVKPVQNETLISALGLDRSQPA